METNVKSKTARSIRLLFLLVLLSGSLHVAGQISVADSSRSVAQATPPKIHYSYDDDDEGYLHILKDCYITPWLIGIKDNSNTQ
jgi:hypothetical protein